jgi:hypothetical protein
MGFFQLAKEGGKDPRGLRGGLRKFENPESSIRNIEQDKELEIL